ncbi:Hypothetical protein R9X50_00108600 [Acrodontium crateriforme]|uniref:Uncharacterized protein n=1 Tax=Acrodontium crateriforme TaxID=150365 RepID=A0AAQ3LYR9_9PEZI|nr:Hypothetical protein R9X50_00108600 [Acrodontium crateriforme]
MASSSVGSDIFAVLSLLVISILVLLLLRHYLPLRTTPGYLLLPVFLALALPCSIILLVPIDLASANDSEESPTRGIWLPERVVLVTWRITYWLTFVLTWFFLPLLGEYCDSGYIDTRSRIIYSLRSNVRYQLITLGTGTVGLIYFILQNGFHGTTIKGLLMALAYAWGLILAIGLMGHGMVALPRRLFKNASISGRLRGLQIQAPKTKDKLDEATEQLEELEGVISQLQHRKHGASAELQEWIDDLADVVPDAHPRVAATARTASRGTPAVMTERYLADLTRKLKRARHKKARFVDEWNSLCERAQETQMILDAATSKTLEFDHGEYAKQSFVPCLKLLTPSMRYHMHMNIIPYSRVGLSILFAVASVMVIWSELIKSIAPKLSIIGLTVVHHPSSESGKIGFAGQMIAAAWLLYMDTCALYAIADVKVWGNRALVKRQTYLESACWYSLQVAKLTVPLSYNFITMFPQKVYEKTSFFQFLGKLIELTPLGDGFNNFFPCFVLVPVLASLFNVYGRMKKLVGFGFLEDESEDNPTGFGTGGWREGRALIDQEIQSRSEGGGHLGLAARGASLDLERRIGPLAGTATPPNGRAQQSRDPLIPTTVQQANRQFRDITSREEAPDDSPRHFYDDFTERVRNTFDTTEQPQWMKNLGSAFTAPRWMQNDDRDNNGGSSLTKWFRGRAEDGRVRL